MQEARKQFFQFLARKKLKFTSQRGLIFDVFWHIKDHVSPEELYNAVKQNDPRVGQATVYRTLKLLCESGIAREVNFGDGVARFEPAFGQSHHDHLICTNCHRSVEVMDPKIEKLQEKLARDHGFTLTGHKLYLFGICPHCREKAR
ncbi:MAG TPA: transcriptional repressor [Desulfonatronum sp.]|nr:transcriptional repressor [Desulfonatronum sp.]